MINKEDLTKEEKVKIVVNNILESAEFNTLYEMAETYLKEYYSKNEKDLEEEFEYYKELNED